MSFDAAKFSTFSLNPALEQGSLFEGGVVKFGGTESPNPTARGLCDHGLCDRGSVTVGGMIMGTLPNPSKASVSSPLKGEEGREHHLCVVCVI